MARFTPGGDGYRCGMRVLGLLRRHGRNASSPGGSSAAGPEGRTDPGSTREAAQRWSEHEELERIRAQMHHRHGLTTDEGSRMEAYLRAFGLPRFPVTREELLARAHQSDAREAVLVDIRSLPEGARFDSMIDVLHGLGVGGVAPLRKPTSAEGSGSTVQQQP